MASKKITKNKNSFANGLEAISPLNATGSCKIPKFGSSHAYHLVPAQGLGNLGLGVRPHNK